MKSERKPKQIKRQDIKAAFDWIESLIPKQRKRFEQLAQVLLAELIIKEYLRSNHGNSKKHAKK